MEIIKTKQEALASADPEVAAEMANKKDIISILSRRSASSIYSPWLNLTRQCEGMPQHRKKIDCLRRKWSARFVAKN
jgi:hypothetical protein